MAVGQIKIPPHSVDAEVSVLGALLIDRDAVVSVAEFLASNHFYDDRHAEVYETIIELYEDRTPIDVLTVSDKLSKRKSLKKIGGTSYLAELANRVPTAAHVEHYAKIVKDFATKRNIMRMAASLVDQAVDEGLAADELLDKAEMEIFSLSQKHLSGGFTAVKNALADSFDRLDELHKAGSGMRGVATGYPDIDNLLAGFQKSNLIILASRPSVGKTTLATNIAQNIAVGLKRPVGMFSLEMSKEELVDRLLVAQADIDAWKLKTGKLDEEDFTKLSNAMGELAEAPLFIDDTPALSILEMRTKSRRLQVESGIDLLIVDYIQLARSRNLENRVQEVAEISQGLKNLARELKIPILAISQLSRAVEQRGTKRPQLADLRESGCLLGDTLLTNAITGERQKIEDLVGRPDFKTFSMDENLKIVPTQVSKIFPSGKKVVYQMILKSGKIVKASSNHPFFKINGWERLDKLAVGDRVAVPRVLPLKLKNDFQISDNRLVVLAHLIGDGCFVKRAALHYTNSEMELIDIVKKAALAEFDIVPKIIKQESWYHLFLSSSIKLARGTRNPIVKWLDEDLKIYGQHSREKIIPNLIFLQLKEKIALFLKHLWATDGCIFTQTTMKGKVSIYYASGSRELAVGVSHLLLRLGILSTITSSSKKGYQDTWNVVIQGKKEQLKFLEVVGAVGKKLQKAKQARKFLSNIEENPNNDVIPKDVWVDIEKLRVDFGMTTREFHTKVGWAYSGTQRHKNGLSRERLKKVLKVLSNDKLEALVDSDLYWDEIKEIKKIGVRQVYDATVPKHANFVANDIIVHNSIEQDADVVMFLWRENEDDASQMVLDVAKHRNGPLGSIKLLFKGDRIKFYGRETKRGK